MQQRPETGSVFCDSPMMMSTPVARLFRSNQPEETVSKGFNVVPFQVLSAFDPLQRQLQHLKLAEEARFTGRRIVI